jgi:hypothetical protein
LENLKGKYRLDYLAVDGRVLLKSFIKKQGVRIFITFVLLLKELGSGLKLTQGFIKAGHYLTSQARTLRKRVS